MIKRIIKIPFYFLIGFTAMSLAALFGIVDIIKNQ